MQKLREVINQILENKRQTTHDAIHADMHLRNDFGFDSLDLAELTVRIESEFGIDIFEDGIVSTVGEVLNKLNQPHEE